MFKSRQMSITWDLECLSQPVWEEQELFNKMNSSMIQRRLSIKIH